MIFLFTEYSVYLNSNPNLNFLTTPSYDLNLECTDAVGKSSSAVLTVLIDENEAPKISNLPTVLSAIDSETDSRIMFDLTTTDVEGDDYTCFISSSVPAAAPFSVVKNPANNGIFISFLCYTVTYNSLCLSLWNY